MAKKTASPAPRRRASAQPPAEATPSSQPAAEWVPIDSVQPDPRNVRERTPRNLAVIERSLVQFGQQKPIVVDADGIIRAGNGTWTVARQLGWKEIWIARSALRGPEAAAYAIADNRANDLSQFDESKLSVALADMPEDLLAAAGFDVHEIGDLLPQLETLDLMGEEGDEPKARSGPSTMIDKDRTAVRVLIAVGNVERIERALLATGKKNREAALLAVCDAYLEAEGQQHLR